MVGLVQASSSMTRAQLSLGYRTVQSLSDGPLLKKGERVRGHEVHCSVLSRDPDDPCAAYGIIEQGGQAGGLSDRVGPGVVRPCAHGL